MRATRSLSNSPRPLRLAAVAAAVMVLVLPGTGRAGTANPDLDPTFGDAGRALTGFTHYAGASDVALVSGGRILAAGTRIFDHFKLALARYRPNGDLDTTFGDNGRVVVGFPGHDLEAGALAVLPSGRFVVGGTLDSQRPRQPATFALVGFLANGDLDAGFGNGGRVAAHLPPGRWNLSSLVRQADGRLLAVGWRQRPVVSRFAAVRFLPDGSIDRTFGNDGHLTTAFPEDADPTKDRSVANDVALDVHGRAVVVGWETNDGCRFRWAIARYLPNGDLDRSFGRDGRVTTEFAQNNARASAVEIGDDDRITVAGSNDFLSCQSPQVHFGTAAVARYLPGGRLDSSFGGDGKVSTRFLGSRKTTPVYYDLALDEGGQIAATGNAVRPAHNDVLVIVGGYLRDGSLNTAFSDDGRATDEGPREYALASALFVDPNGRPIVAGTDGGVGNDGRFMIDGFVAPGAG